MTNPLLSLSFRIPFHDVTAAHVELAVDEAIRMAQGRIEALSTVTGGFEECMVAFEHLAEELDYATSAISHIESVATSPEFRAAYDRAHPKYAQFYSGILLSDGLWNMVQRYAGTAEATTLSGARRRYLDEVVKDFRLMGADLKPDQKTRMRAIDAELAQLTSDYAHHVLDATNAYELLIEDRARLAGLPESAIEAAAEGAVRKGKQGYRFTLQQPSLVAILTYLDDRSIREAVYQASSTRCSGGALDNLALVRKILSLRAEKAEMLGFSHFADFVLNRRMAKDAKTASAFVDDLFARVYPKALEEHQTLQAFRDRLDGSNSQKLQPWDVAYYAEKLRKEQFDFDEEELRPYFPFDRVLSGAFAIAERLYGISIKKVSGYPTWHDEVQVFEVRDGDRLVGAFYTDFFPRESKRGGAWMNDLITGELKAGVLGPHLGVICGNFNSPSGGRPALLTHDEVTTLLHEFGHLLHGLLSEVPLRGLAGTRVAWDFVELPSQIMENWCWEKEALGLLSGHYQTGEPIPEDLFNRLKRSQKFRTASLVLRQLGFCAVDLALHTGKQFASDEELLEWSRGLLQKYSVFDLPQYHAMIASFSHLFSGPVGYAAGYYSYQWAEVLDADAFSRFQAEGIFNRDTGLSFRREILARGNEADAARLFRAFMGREPDLSAYLARAGLASSPNG